MKSSQGQTYAPNPRLDRIRAGFADRNDSFRPVDRHTEAFQADRAKCSDAIAAAWRSAPNGGNPNEGGITCFGCSQWLGEL